MDLLRHIPHSALKVLNSLTIVPGFASANGYVQLDGGAFARLDLLLWGCIFITVIYYTSLLVSLKIYKTNFKMYYKNTTNLPRYFQI